MPAAWPHGRMGKDYCLFQFVLGLTLTGATAGGPEVHQLMQPTEAMDCCSTQRSLVCGRSLPCQCIFARNLQDDQD